MARIATATLEKTSPEAQEFLNGAKQRLGMVPNIFATMAQSDAALGFYKAASQSLSKGKLAGKIAEKIALGTAQYNQCRYCLAAHTRISQGLGMSEAEIAMARNFQCGDAKTNAVLQLAKSILENRGHASAEALNGARDAGITDEEIIETVAIVAMNVFTNYFNETVQTDVDFPAVSVEKPSASGQKMAGACCGGGCH